MRPKRLTPTFLRQGQLWINAHPQDHTRRSPSQRVAWRLADTALQMQSPSFSTRLPKMKLFLLI